MENFYLVGEPIFKPPTREEYYAPVSQVVLCQEVFRETQDIKEVINKLREEYLAIVWSLVQMGINFRIVYAHENEIDQKALGVCVQALRCRLVGFHKDFFPPSVAYPRDFATVLPGLILVNNQGVELRIEEKNGYRIFSSPYGEGGRVLFSQKTILVGERLVGEENRSLVAESRDLEKIGQIGIRVGTIPCPLAQVFSTSSEINRFFFNDHLDRIACLIQGKDGNLHLVVDPGLLTANWKGKEGVFWTPHSPAETLEKIRSVCDPLKIQVHCPKMLKVPYSLNLIQFPNGRVLMTGGDDSVAEIIEKIVGEENVFKTPTPIRFFPAWAYAGIRCLVSEAPLPLFKHRGS